MPCPSPTPQAGRPWGRRALAALLLGLLLAPALPAAALTRDQLIEVPGVDLPTLHQGLVKAGFPPGPYNPEELDSLAAALSRFQLARGLKITGRLDAQTWQALRSPQAAPAGGPAPEYNPEAAASGPEFNPEAGPESRPKAQPEAQPRPAQPDKDLKLVMKLPLESLDLRRPLKVDQPVLAVQKIECSTISGHWIIFYQGMLCRLEPDKGQALVRLEKRFGYRYRPQAQGINSKDWWCSPRRRHCYSQVKFSDWGGRDRPQQVVAFPLDQVFSREIGVINAMALYMQTKCAK